VEEAERGCGSEQREREMWVRGGLSVGQADGIKIGRSDGDCDYFGGTEAVGDRRAFSLTEVAE
jgi:hypothetical protein